MDFKDYLTESPENVENTKCDRHFVETGKNPMKNARNVDFTKCDGHFEEMGESERGTEKELEGAAGDFKVGEYIAYLWGETIEYGYILEIGEAGTVWVGEEPDAWIKRLVEIPPYLDKTGI